MRSLNRQIEAAAAPTLERIRNDRGRAPARSQPLLEHLESHLFDPGLDWTRLKQACGVRDDTLPLLFHQVVSLPPYAYIEDCRLEVACRLLTDTELHAWQIAQRLGYSAVQVFSRDFDRWAGVRPTVFRKQTRQSGEAAAPNGTEVSWPRPATFVRAIQGRLQRHEADELLGQLRELYPESFVGPFG